MNQFPIRVGIVWCLFIGLAPTGHADINVETVLVGEPGNKGTPYGAVNYAYRIGTYEVTNDQYAAFLNAKAKIDPWGLFNAEMASDPHGGIIQTESNGEFSYEVKANMGRKPVNYVDYIDSMRFANWLSNGQGDGDTETGAYTMSLSPRSIRNRDAKWFLPSENEWYKAAYYDPTLNQGIGKCCSGVFRSEGYG